MKFCDSYKPSLIALITFSLVILLVLLTLSKNYVSEVWLVFVILQN